jgi:hypothetical protein
MKFTGVLEKRPIIPANQAPDNFDRFVYLVIANILSSC